MRLFEHPDFEQVVLDATDHFAERGMRPAIVEKDYYVTEVLRIIADTVGDKTIFKGGTSLSKGWNLIGRFSEDMAPRATARARQRAQGLLVHVCVLNLGLLMRRLTGVGTSRSLQGRAPALIDTLILALDRLRRLVRRRWAPVPVDPVIRRGLTQRRRVISPCCSRYK